MKNTRARTKKNEKRIKWADLKIKEYTLFSEGLLDQTNEFKKVSKIFFYQTGNPRNNIIIELRDEDYYTIILA